VYTWVKAADALSYQKPGPKTGWKLDWEALRRQVEQQADLTLQERAQHFRVSRHGIWNALRKMELRRKKKAGLPRTQPRAPETVSAASGTLCPAWKNVRVPR
jgi:hypothetical protein